MSTKKLKRLERCKRRWLDAAIPLRWLAILLSFYMFWNLTLMILTTISFSLAVLTVISLLSCGVYQLYHLADLESLRDPWF